MEKSSLTSANPKAGSKLGAHLRRCSKSLGDVPAVAVTRKDITNIVIAIIERGAKVQAGNVLQELSAAYEYAIGLEKLPDTFANPALLVKAGLRQAKVARIAASISEPLCFLYKT